MEFTECEKTALEDTVVELQHQVRPECVIWVHM